MNSPSLLAALKAINARKRKPDHGGERPKAVLLGEGVALSEVRERITSGISVLDWHILGARDGTIGGWPVGRISELYAEEALGKTSLVWQQMGRIQRAGGVAAYIDSERSVDRDRMADFGINVDAMLVAQPDGVEDALSGCAAILGALNAEDGPHFVAWDSLAAATPRAETDGSYEDNAVGAKAVALNRGFRKLGSLVAQRRAHLLVVNQVRYKIGVVFGDPRTTPGGQALKHHASLRLSLSPKGFVKKGDIKIGFDVTVRTAKSRFTPPRDAVVRFLYASGWDEEWSTVNHAVESELMDPTAAKKPSAYARAMELLGWGEGKADARAPKSIEAAAELVISAEELAAAKPLRKPKAVKASKKPLPKKKPKKASPPPEPGNA